jgi:hypothetical protein
MADVAVEQRSKSELYDELEEDYDLAVDYRQKFVEARWRDVVSLVVPKYGVCGTQAVWPDGRYDSIATECSTLLGDGMFGNLCPSNMMWFRYQFEKAQLNNEKTGAGLLEQMTEHMAQVFNRSTFYDVGPEYLMIGNSIATAAMDVREDKETQSIICSIEHPRAVYCKVNARGEVVETYIVRYLTADQIGDEFGEDALTDAMKTSLSSPSNTEYELVEVCKRRGNAKPDSPLASEWKYGEYTFLPGDPRKKVILESGAKELPKIVWRWSLRGNEAYGWGPINDCMPDIRTCNQMIRTMLEVKNKQAKPAEWYPSEGRTWSSDPGAKNYYRDPNRRMFKDEITGYNFDWEALQIIQQRVRKAMKVDHFLMLMQIEAQMTAREVMERKREGMSVVASTVGAFETMALDRVHARMLQIEANAGRLPGFRPGDKLPPELMAEALRVEYLGPISQQQKQLAVEQGIMSALESSVSVFKLWNQTLAKIKPEILIDKIWAANGAPTEALKDDQEYQKTLADAAKAQQAQQQAAMQAEIAKKVNPQVAPEAGSQQAQAMQVVRDQQGRIAGIQPTAGG